MILKKTSMLAIAILPLIGFAQTGNFVIEGKISPKHNGRFIKLYYSDGEKKIADSTVIGRGAFVLKGQLSAPTLAKLSMDNEKMGDQVDVFLSEGEIKATTKDSIRYTSFSGNKLTTDHERLAQRLRPIDYPFFSRLAAFQKMPEGEAKKAYIIEVLSGMDTYRASRDEAIHQFVLENPFSYISLYYLDKNSPGRLANYETTYPYYDKLSKEIKETPLGRQFGARLVSAKGMTGQAYKDFVSTTPEGNQLSLKELIGKNKYTLVDFWASWCGPCRKENPYVVKTFNSFKDKGFTVLSVSLDDKADKWKEAIVKDGMPWYHVSSLKGWKEPAAELYNIKAIPQNVLVDGQGKVIATNLRGETLYQKIEELTR